jgi:hypothetical protein
MHGSAPGGTSSVQEHAPQVFGGAEYVPFRLPSARRSNECEDAMIVVLQRGHIYKWARVIKSPSLRIDNDLSSENNTENGKRRCGVFGSYLGIITAMCAASPDAAR